MKITTKQYIDNQLKWVRRLQKEKDRHVVFEGKLRESEVTAIREAVRVYNEQNNEWKAGSNEWRAQSRDQTANYPTKDEMKNNNMAYDQRINEVNKRLDTVAAFMERSQGKGTGMNSLWVIGIAAILMLCAVGSMILSVMTYFKK
jgi:hypothetical protein